ncbi:MAG: Gfo/Idh/MocA family protein [Christensenellales bacterium]|jgi:predicted dehydrogenase
MKQKIKVVHFGIAHDHSTATLMCARSFPDVFDVAAICEPDADTRRQFEHEDAYKGIPWITEEELFARGDIDAVFCEGYELRSVSDAQKCIDRGLHVHLDKPGGTDLATFEHLLKSADEKGLTLQMGYMYRYNPAFKYTLDAVKSGKLGRITGIDASFSRQDTPEKRKWLGRFPGGMMFYLGCHILDMILLINGMPERVIPFNRSSDWNNDGSMDSSFAVLDYPHGACSVRINGNEVNGMASRRLRVVGTLGTVEILPLEYPTVMTEALLKDAENANSADVARRIFPGYISGRYDEMMLDFAACVRGEKTNPYTSGYELALQRVLLEACR